MSSGSVGSRLPHVVGSTRLGGPPFGRCPLAFPNPAPFSRRWYQMIILAGAERGIQGVSGPVVRSEDAPTCGREDPSSTFVPNGSRRLTDVRPKVHAASQMFVIMQASL